jgi:hypothetical protein
MSTYNFAKEKVAEDVCLHSICCLSASQSFSEKSWETSTFFTWWEGMSMSHIHTSWGKLRLQCQFRKMQYNATLHYSATYSCRICVFAVPDEGPSLVRKLSSVYMTRFHIACQRTQILPLELHTSSSWKSCVIDMFLKTIMLTLKSYL